MCVISLRHTQSRSCPQPDVIEQHLRETIGFEGHIATADKVCYSCYKSHLVILQESRNTSRDSDLEGIISTLKQASANADSICSTTELLNAALNRVTIEVGKALLEKEVVHLPAVHDQFQRYVNELSAASHLEEDNVVKLVPSTWLLSGLTANLKHHITYSCKVHIAYSCKVRKYGTILYRPNADLLPSIQKAMWRVRHLELARGEPQPESNPNTMHDTCTQPPDRRVLDDLNDRVHNEVRRLLAANVHTPMKHDQLDVERFIQEADPQLWQAVCLLTRSVSDRKSLKTDGTKVFINALVYMYLCSPRPNLF